MVLDGFMKAIENKKPLVHVITNAVTINDCANALLAIGASPIMAEDPAEVEEIVQLSDALVLNLGMPNPAKLKAMELAGRKAARLHIPIVFDPVGVGASSFRLQAAKRLLQQIPFSVIRGNSSEIMALMHEMQEAPSKENEVVTIPAEKAGNNTGNNTDNNAGKNKEKGVDAAKNELSDGLSETLSKELCEFAGKCGAVIILSGKTDYVICNTKIVAVYNGDANLGKVTGTGCQLSAILGAFLAAKPDEVFEAALAGVGAMGVCGEIASSRLLEGEGSGMFRVRLMDALSHLEDGTLSDGIRSCTILENIIENR